MNLRTAVDKLLANNQLVSDFTYTPVERYIPAPGYIISVTSIDDWETEVDQLIAAISADTLQVEDYSGWPIERITSIRAYKIEAEFVVATAQQIA
jgi:hypothetical protein